MEVCSQNLFDPKTVLLKVNGNKCNMACEYCSEIPKVFSAEQCTFNYEKIREILEMLPKDVDIILHGGEPSLIGIENVKKIASLIKKLGFTITPSIQTNALLSDPWVKFLKENKDLIRVSASIDGNMYCNSFRKTKKHNSRTTYNKINDFLQKIDKEGVEFRCIATINSLSWDKGEQIITYFNQFENLKFLRLNPCFDLDHNGLKSWAITPKQYLECLKSSFVTMIKTESYKCYKLDPLMDIAENLKRSTTKFEFKCDKFSSVFPDGTVTSCDAMREIQQPVVVNHEMFSQFVHPQYVSEVIDKCNKCNWLSLCKGGCPPLMERYSRYNPDLLEEYCQYRVDIRRFIMSVISM